ncbi:MAG: GNAT family N-acetyltransferase [Bacteroidales bacterium]|jgi:ribosomal protein S18 acetylase RimI-like enzyme|nr:GNAT family N-acetyltransferase [Bacteroidales bacterium]
MNTIDKINYSVSVGNAADIEAIAQFQVDMALESEGTVLDKEKVLLGVTAAVNDVAKGTYLVCRVDGQAISSLMLTREWSDWNNQWYWWIQSVFVKPEFRGKGAYRAMYEKIKEMAQEQNISQVRLYVDKTNYPAQQVYKKLGMDECHYLMYEEVLSI